MKMIERYLINVFKYTPKEAEEAYKEMRRQVEEDEVSVESVLDDYDMPYDYKGELL